MICQGERTETETGSPSFLFPCDKIKAVLLDTETASAIQ